MSKDTAKKKAGPPDSLSRAQEKANKRNTNKKRRQDDRKQGRLNEKAVSKAQQRFMGMIAAGKIDAPKGLSKKEARKFAKTKHDGLPERVSESMPTFKQFLESATLHPDYLSKQTMAARKTECEICGKQTDKDNTRMLKGKLSCPSCVKNVDEK